MEESHPMLLDAGAQTRPVPSRLLDRYPPHVRLHNTLAHWAAIICFVWTLHLRQFITCFQSGEVDGFKNIPGCKQSVAAHERYTQS